MVTVQPRPMGRVINTRPAQGLTIYDPTLWPGQGRPCACGARHSTAPALSAPTQLTRHRPGAGSFAAVGFWGPAWYEGYILVDLSRM
jgi:hypothetical protein